MGLLYGGGIMGFIIEDGKGTGTTAKVNSENMLETKCVGVDFEQHINEDHGQAYSAGIQQTPTAAGDCFAYITNNSDGDMIVSALMLAAASDEYVVVKLGDTGTAIGGDTVTPGNRNAGSGNEADVTAEQGVDITGLSGGTGVMRIFLDGGVSSKKYDICSCLIIPKNKTISFYCVTGAIQITMGVAMFFHETHT